MRFVLQSWAFGFPNSLPQPALPLNPCALSCDGTNVFIVNFLCAILFYTMGQWWVLNWLEIVHTFQHAICRKGWSAHLGLHPCSTQREEGICDTCFPCELWLLWITVQMKHILVSAFLSKSLYCSLAYGNKIKPRQEVPKIVVVWVHIIPDQKKVFVAHAELTMILMVF